MTREEAIALQPGLDITYWLTFVGAGAAGIIFPAGFFLNHPHTADDWQFLFLGLLALPLAAQSAERLFWPIRAAQRTAGLAPNTRDLLGGAKPILDVLLWAIVIWTICTKWIEPLWMFFPLTYQSLFADILGEQRPRFHERPLSKQRFWRDNIKPIHSDHWGNR